MDGPSRPEIAYGVVQLGHAQVALPLQALREVIPCPAQFDGLPATAPGLLGAVNVRGRIVPVLDLRGLLGLEPAPLAEPIVVLMRHDDRLIGLRADGVRGITRPAAAAVHPVEAGGGLLYSGSFERPEDASVVSVLDPAAVLALPGLPSLRELHESAARPAAAPGPALAQRPLMLLRCGGIGLGIEVADVHATLPRVRLQPSCLGGTLCRGVIEHGDLEVPAIDALALAGLGALPADEPCEALLLRFEQGLVALLVSRVIDIVQVGEHERLAPPALALCRPELFHAMLRVAGQGEHLVLGLGVLHARADLAALAGMNVRRAGAPPRDTEAGDARAQGRTVITFDVGAEAATLLGQVREIVPLPAARLRPEARHPAVVGLFSQRGQSVTLLCLATLLGQGGGFDEASACVLLVGDGDTVFGFVVRRLCQIETTLWEQPGDGAGAPAMLGRHPLVELGVAERRRTLPLIDLHRLACTALAGEVVPEPADAVALPSAGAAPRRALRPDRLLAAEA
jgi:purine-binding chemotaxis protein CheW